MVAAIDSINASPISAGCRMENSMAGERWLSSKWPVVMRRSTGNRRTVRQSAGGLVPYGNRFRLIPANEPTKDRDERRTGSDEKHLVARRHVVAFEQTFLGGRREAVKEEVNDEEE